MKREMKKQLNELEQIPVLLNDAKEPIQETIENYSRVGKTSDQLVWDSFILALSPLLARVPKAAIGMLQQQLAQAPLTLDMLENLFVGIGSAIAIKRQEQLDQNFGKTIKGYGR